MILDPDLTAAYIVVAFALAVIPGPDVIFVVANGMQHRMRGAIASVLGIGCGSLGHAFAAAAGVSAILAASPLAFSVLQYAGVVYLAYLGMRALRSFWNGAKQATPQEVEA